MIDLSYCFVILFFFEASSFFLLKKIGLITKEFPEVNKMHLKRFETFDPDLGWEPKKNSIQKDAITSTDDGNKKKISVDYIFGEHGERKAINLLPNKITTFGDSYCLCREVDGDETWQHYLSKDLSVGVANYGVGNYGLDQALLRLKRKYEDDPAQIVIMAVTPYTFERVGGVWKHYCEFGNTFGFKPRFIFSNKGLEYIPNPMRTRDGIPNASLIRDYLRRLDENYRFWFTKVGCSFPYSYSLAVNVKHVISFALHRLHSYCKNYLSSTSLNLIFYVYAMIDPKNKYLKISMKRNDEIIKGLLSDFVDFCNQKNAQPILFIISDRKIMENLKICGRYYKKLFDEVRELNENLVVIDSFDVFKDINNLGDYFINGDGHHNSKGNKLLSQLIKNKLGVFNAG